MSPRDFRGAMSDVNIPAWFYKWLIAIAGTIFMGLCMLIWFMFTGYINRQEKNWDEQAKKYEAITNKLNQITDQYGIIDNKISSQDDRMERNERDISQLFNNITVLDRRMNRIPIR